MLQLDRLLDELSKLEASKQLVPVLVFLCLDYAVPGVVDEAQYVTLFLLRYLKVGQCRLEMRLVGCPEQSTSGTNGQYTLLFSRFNISVSGKHNNNKPLYFLFVYSNSIETGDAERWQKKEPGNDVPMQRPVNFPLPTAVVAWCPLIVVALQTGV